LYKKRLKRPSLFALDFSETMGERRCDLSAIGFVWGGRFPFQSFQTVFVSGRQSSISDVQGALYE
jgi:hypothetical protein